MVAVRKVHRSPFENLLNLKVVDKTQQLDMLGLKWEATKQTFLTIKRKLVK